ncbi:hypothetical protein GF325_04220 [Candidatus Bathyarchaeota archaeon]|nr:hypothetical protein [Candidatus Bathyarchaeota archaeon]
MAPVHIQMEGYPALTVSIERMGTVPVYLDPAHATRSSKREAAIDGTHDAIIAMTWESMEVESMPSNA